MNGRIHELIDRSQVGSDSEEAPVIERAAIEQTPGDADEDGAMTGTESGEKAVGGG